MSKRILFVILVMFVVAACSPQASNDVLPTVATLDDAASSTETAPVDQPTVESADNTQESNTVAGDLTLTDSIESETGVTYQLPADWSVNDNDSVSNFASDEDAVLDYLSTDPERNDRWIIMGSVGTTTPDEVSDLESAASFEEAAALLHAYYFTDTADIQPPTIVTLENGNQASVAVKHNENMPGKTSAVYFVDTGSGTYINVFFEAREDIMMDNASLREAIVNSAFVR